MPVLLTKDQQWVSRGAGVKTQGRYRQSVTQRSLRYGLGCGSRPAPFTLQIVLVVFQGTRASRVLARHRFWSTDRAPAICPLSADITTEARVRLLHLRNHLPALIAERAVEAMLIFHQAHRKLSHLLRNVTQDPALRQGQVPA